MTPSTIGENELLARFDHHPDPAIDFEIEVQSLEARLFDAKGGISKPGTEPETVETVGAAIERAMTFIVGGDPSAVEAKSVLRRLEREAWDFVHAKVTDDLQSLGEEFGVLSGENRLSGLRRVLTEMRSELDRRKDGLGTVSVKPLEWEYQIVKGSQGLFDGFREFVQVTGSYREIEGAEAALQRDFETRVKSCLTSIGVEAGK